MKTIRPSSAEEAVLEWLTAELNSIRFCVDLRKALRALKCDEGIITRPNLESDHENELRWRILKSYQNWLDSDFHNYSWELVELNQEDASKLSYIDYSYWNELSDGTRLVGQAVKNVSCGKVVFDVPNDGFLKAAEYIASGAEFRPIIILANDDHESGEIFEGHLRATAYVLAKKAASPLKAIWGKPI